MKTRLRWLPSAVLLMMLFAPASSADEVRTDEKGTFLGALFATPTEGRHRLKGAVITHVLTDSPAALAELRRNDVVLEYDRHLIRDATHLAQLICADKPNRKIHLVVLRGQRLLGVEVTLALGPPLKLAESLTRPKSEPAEPVRTGTQKASVSVRATPLNSGKVQWRIEYSAPSGKKVVTCEGAAAELSRTLQKLPERERQLVRIALERLRALDRPRPAAPRR
jgi:hypothetical protein